MVLLVRYTALEVSPKTPCLKGLVPRVAPWTGCWEAFRYVLAQGTVGPQPLSCFCSSAHEVSGLLSHLLLAWQATLARGLQSGPLAHRLELAES